ncbi:tetratricopeptide repeat protein [Oryzomonas sagensis]|uniref:Tetratricopeptide repeat protein n=1 Tax=Oryzomonas sagensis TaxID=2603857 RepID=A0ABQ6TQL0_9BACT|nr:LysM peptidoglycan-binding domain-containing protein [Oryzomonas sagensis]KAB0671313.1 tetratricopeptide repeat protein [Oryzomonas sagensis]
MARRPWGTAAAALIFSLAVVPAWGEQQYLYTPKPVGPEEQGQGKDGILVREVPVEKGDTLSGISRRFSGHGSYYPQILLFNDVKNPNLIYAGSTLRVPVSAGQAAAAEPSEAQPTPAARKKSVRHAGRKKASRAVQPPSAAVPAKRKQQSATGKAPGDRSMDLSPSDLKQLDSGREKKAELRKKAAPEARNRGVEGRQKAKQPVGEERVTKSVPASVPAATGEDAGQKLFAQAVKAYRQDDFRGALELFDRFLAKNPGSPLAADASLYKAECYLKLSSQ